MIRGRPVTRERTHSQRWRALLRRLDRIGGRSWAAHGSWQQAAQGAAESSAFVCSHAGGRWVLEQPAGVLRIVADRRRCLVTEEGGLRRVPAAGRSTPWSAEPAGLLFRPESWLMGAAELAPHTLVEGPAADQVAGRPCSAVTLRVPQEGKRPYRLWVDDATGLRLRCATPELDVTVGKLIVDQFLGDPATELLRLLDMVPDVDLTPMREPRPDAAAYVAAITRTMGDGCHVSVLAFPGEGSFTMRIDGSPFGIAVLDRRASGHSLPYRRVLARLHVWGFAGWAYSLDVNADVPEDQLHRLARALPGVMPDA